MNRFFLLRKQKPIFKEVLKRLLKGHVLLPDKTTTTTTTTTTTLLALYITYSIKTQKRFQN